LVGQLCGDKNIFLMDFCHERILKCNYLNKKLWIS